MDIDVYQSELNDGTVIYGFVVVTRMYIGIGVYSNSESDIVICVTEKSMPNSKIRGTFRCDKSKTSKHSIITL